MVAGRCLLLVASQPDMGTAMVIAFTLDGAAGRRRRARSQPGHRRRGRRLPGAVFALAEPYRRARLTSFIDPWAHAGGTGFQAVQGQIALGSGGMFGVGLGESVQKIFYLPEAHTDMILAIIGEELGVVGIMGVIFLYGMIAYAGLRAAKMAKDAYAKLLAAGHHVADPVPGDAELLRRARAGAADRRAAAVPLLRSTNLVVLMGGMGLLLNVAATGGRPQAAQSCEGSTPMAAEGRDRGRRDGGSRRAGAGGR